MQPGEDRKWLVVARPGLPAELFRATEDPVSLKTMQELVEGQIETVRWFDSDVIDVWFNEEGRMRDMPRNRRLITPEGGEYPIVGPLVVSGRRRGDTVGLDRVVAQRVCNTLNGIGADGDVCKLWDEDGLQRAPWWGKR